MEKRENKVKSMDIVPIYVCTRLLSEKFNFNEYVKSFLASSAKFETLVPRSIWTCKGGGQLPAMCTPHAPCAPHMVHTPGPPSNICPVCVNVSRIA